MTDTTLTIETVTKPEGAIGDVQYGYTTGDETEVPAATLEQQLHIQRFGPCDEIHYLCPLLWKRFL